MIRAKKKVLAAGLIFLFYGAAFFGRCAISHADSGDNGSDPVQERKTSVPFFDGIKLQTTNCNPKLTNANHIIQGINKATGSNLSDWDTMLIQSIDVVLWKDLSKYFKTDFAVGGATGALVSSSTGFAKTPLEMAIRMRQRYSAVELWSNIYFYPLTTDHKDEYASGHVVEPFIAAGIGYTFFRSEAVFKLRKSNLLYDRVRSNWNGDDWGYKLMTGFNVNLGNVTPRLARWIITVSAFQIWNRMQGQANIYFTEGMKIAGKSAHRNLHGHSRMDIDLTGPHFSIGVGSYF